MKALVFILCLMAVTGYSQEVNFFNTNQNLINLNPSFAGSNGFLRNQTIYRADDKGGDGSTSIVSVSDVFLKSINGGIAASCLYENEQMGLYRTWAGSLTYAQHISFCEGSIKLVPSAQVSYFEKEMDLTKLHFSDYFAPDARTPWLITTPLESNPKKHNVSVSSGFIVQCSKGFSGGAYFFNLNQPDQGLLGEEPLPLRIVLHSSYNFMLGEKNMLQVFSRFTKQTNHHFLQISGNAVIIKHVIAGAGYVMGTMGNDVTMQAGYRGNFFSVTLGHDIWYEENNPKDVKSWELALSINLRDKTNRKALTPFEKM